MDRLPSAQLLALAVESPPGPILDGFMMRYERDVIVSLLKAHNARVVVEIGVQMGQCAQYVLDRVSGIQAYYGIDCEPGYKTSLPVQQAECPGAAVGQLVRNNLRFNLITRPRGSLDLAPAEIPSCDAMLIDGDHGWHCVVHDTVLADACVRHGGLVLWHDYWPAFDTDVVKWLNGLQKSGRNIVHIPDTWLAMEQRD